MCGLNPNEVLDLNLGQVQAVVDGYGDSNFEHSCQPIWIGYYAAYYSNSKHPKKPQQLIKDLTKNRDKLLKRGIYAHNTPVEDVQDGMAKFKEREALHKSYRDRSEKNGNRKRKL